MHQLNIVLGAGLGALLLLVVVFMATVGRRYDVALRRRNGDAGYVDATPIWFAGGVSDGGAHCSSDGGGGSCDGGGGGS